MKKFYSFLVAAVLLMGATSCQKEATADAGAADNVEFVASIAGGRTELGNGNKVMWNNGDKIRIFTQENFAGTEFDSDATAATATAKFTTTKSFTASNNGYLAVYPETANVKKELQGFSVVEVVNEATYAGGVWSVPVKLQEADHEIPESSFYEQSGLMVAYSNDNELSFNAAVAMLKIKCQGGQWGKFEASGANLAGEATLHYDPTAEEPISYTLAEGDTFIEYTMNATDGTYYLPIYPGTVNDFCIFEGNKKIAEYNKPFTFKAGIIYDLDLDNAGGNAGGEETEEGETLWEIMDNSTYEFTSMVKVEDYFVAENITIGANGINFNSWNETTGVSGFFGMFGDFTLGQWIELADANIGEAVRIANGGIDGNVDVYLNEEAMMFCIVPAGTETIPALPVAPSYEESPYMLMDMTTSSVISMVIKEGFHYAKLTIPSGEEWLNHSYLVVDPDGNGLGFTTATAAPATWYQTGAWSDTSAYQPITIESYLGMEAEVYVSADGAWMGVAYPGFALPAVPTQSAWGLVGSHQGWDVANVTTMWTKGNFAVAENVVFDSATEFKFVIRNNNSDWSSAVGYPWRNITSNSAYSLVNWTFENESNNITLAAGTYDIYLATTSNDAPAYFVVVDKGASTVLASTDIYIHARNTESDWNTSAMEFDGTYFVKKNVSFSSGIEFLFKATPDAWNIKWCGITNATLNAANTLQMYNDANITNTNSGTYDIYTDLKSVWIMNSGSYPEN